MQPWVKSELTKHIGFGCRSVWNNVGTGLCFDWTGTEIYCFVYFFSGGQRSVSLPREKGSVCDPGGG